MIRVIKMMGRIDFIFLFLIFGVFLINLPYGGASLLPQHDTLYNFQIFYFFYNEYFFHHTIAQWIPYGTYGVPAAPFQLGVLSPAEYFSGFLGAFLGVKNVLFLFKAATLLEQFTFLLGMYFLAKALFERRVIILMVCIASFCSMEWLYQIFWNLRLYEFFPFALYFLVLFFERKRSLYFWMAGIIGIIWFLGTWFYMSFLFIFLGCIICAVLFTYHQGAWKDIWPRRRLDAAVMVFFFVIAASYILFFKNSFEHVAILHRSSSSGAANSLDIFMTYGFNASFNSVVTWLFTADPLYTLLGKGRDNTVYVGFATIVFFVWSLAFVRDKYYVAILTCFLVLVWMSFGGIITNLVYYFPGLKFYRHVGLVYPLVKICVALGAGFGLADFLKCSGSVWMKRLLMTIGICLLLVDASGISYVNKGIIVPIMMIYFIAFLIWVGIRSIVIIWSKNTNHSIPPRFLEHAFAILLIAALCLDVTTFRKALYDGWPKLPKRMFVGLKSVEVNELPYIKQRGQEPTGRQVLAFLLQQGAKNKSSAQYESVYGFAQSDPCNEISKVGPETGVLTAGLNELLGVKFSNNDEKDRIRGCSAPKLRLLESEKYFSNTKDESDYMQSTAPLDDLVLLQVPQRGAMAVSVRKAEDSRKAGTVEVKGFTANQLDVWADIKKKDGAWLVYADSFYPGWHAYVDGASTTVYGAFLAFKAVFVPEGKHEVRFVFFNSLTSILSYIIAIFGLMAGAGIFLLLLITLAGLFFPLKRTSLQD